MHLLLSVLPLVAFTVVESRAGLGPAVGASLLAAIPSLMWTWRTHHRLDRITLGALGLAVVLGGASILSDDPRFVLWSPVVGDAVIAGLVGTLTATGRDPLAAALREADPDAELSEEEIRWLRAVGWRLVGMLLLHAAWSAWSTTQPRTTWLFVTGPGGWLLSGGWILGEAAWARLGSSTDQD